MDRNRPPDSVDCCSVAPGYSMAFAVDSGPAAAGFAVAVAVGSLVAAVRTVWASSETGADRRRAGLGISKVESEISTKFTGLWIGISTWIDREDQK